jgi:putative ABC transport system permease protein
MLKHYIIISVRNLIRNKVHSLINIGGLSIGMAAFIIIGTFVWQEFHYDNFHEHADFIYRIYTTEKAQEGYSLEATTPLPLPQTLINDYPRIGKVAYFNNLTYGSPINIGEKRFDANCFTANTEAFHIFHFPLLVGNPDKILNDPHSAVITESAAEKFFGKDNPVGKRFSIQKLDFTVVGVMKNIPNNSIFKFDILVSDGIMKIIFPDLQNRWYHGGSYTYILVNKHENINQLEKDLAGIPEKYFPDFLKGRQEYHLQLLKSIHLNDDVKGDLIAPISPVYLYFLITVAIAVLLIACFSFINLSTAKSFQRAKEIGIKKVLGSTRKSIIFQFAGEAIILSLIALNFGIILAKLGLPYFNQLAEKNTSLVLSDYKTIFLLLGFAIGVGLLASLYPALYISRFKPVDVLYAKLKLSSRTYFRKTIIISQFVITIALLVSTLFILKQIHFMKNQDLGFNPGNLLVVPLAFQADKRMDNARVLLNDINLNAASLQISKASLSENIPGYYFQNKFGIIHDNNPPETAPNMLVTSIDENFTQVYQTKLLEGRNFSPAFSTDKYKAVILNEEAMKILGWNSCIGKQIDYRQGGGPYQVIGVIADLHIKSLKNALEPIVYRYAGDDWNTAFLTVRILPSKKMETITFLKKEWAKLNIEEPFDFFFVKDKFFEQYKEETRISKIAGTFSFFAILLACLGLFGLVAFITERRTKEIGIRKVNGADYTSIILLLTNDIFQLIWVSLLVASPIAWYFMHTWLQNFAYKTPLSWWIFLLAGLVILIISLLTLSWQAWKTVSKNPIEALRYE